MVQNLLCLKAINFRGRFTMSVVRAVHVCSKRLESYGLIAMIAGFVLAILPIEGTEVRAFAVFLFLAGVIAGVVGVVDMQMNHRHPA